MDSILGELVCASGSDAKSKRFSSVGLSFGDRELEVKTYPPDAPVMRARRPRISLSDIMQETTIQEF